VPGHGPAHTPAAALEIAEADLAYLRALRAAVTAAGDNRARALALATAVPLPRAAPDDLADELAANIAAQLAELLP
jgi:hypothetical protein